MRLKAISSIWCFTDVIGFFMSFLSFSAVRKRPTRLLFLLMVTSFTLLFSRSFVIGLRGRMVLHWLLLCSSLARRQLGGFKKSLFGFGSRNKNPQSTGFFKPSKRWKNSMSLTGRCFATLESTRVYLHECLFLLGLVRCFQPEQCNSEG